MKGLIRLAVVVAVMVAGISSVSAQQAKIGYIRFDELVTSMPEYKTAGEEFEKKVQEIETQRTKMQEEWSAAVKEYEEKAGTFTQIVRQAKEQEIMQMQQRIQNFVELAQQELKSVNEQLMAPIYEKAKTTVDEVAKANGYTYVFDASALIYMAPDASDLMPLVKSKLGI
ncbi:MAG: OmpH family outer membrane protein [Marinifilaceae bacterium]|nr:OmpH family outer membrane protein [Marinifilaceae bacterium]